MSLLTEQSQGCSSKHSMLAHCHNWSTHLVSAVKGCQNNWRTADKWATKLRQTGSNTSGIKGSKSFKVNVGNALPSFCIPNKKHGDSARSCFESYKNFTRVPSDKSLSHSTVHPISVPGIVLLQLQSGCLEWQGQKASQQGMLTNGNQILTILQTPGVIPSYC